MPASTVMTALGLVEFHDLLEVGGVQKQHVAAELLAPHGMAPPRHADWPRLTPGFSQRDLQVVDGSRLPDFMHAGGIEPAIGHR